MRGPQPAELKLSEIERKELEALVRRHNTPQQLVKRAQMMLAADEGKRNGPIARELGVCVDTVRSWRMRWLGWQRLSLSDFSIVERLSDNPRPGRPSQITMEQSCLMIAFACEQPEERPISRLSRARDRRGNDAARDHQLHFATSCVPPLKKGDLQPHLIRYWLTP